jgi:transcriptional regulator with XRE-family HTH domain
MISEDMKTPNEKNIIGNYLKERRKELKLSQHQVADMTRIHLKQLSKIENGWVIPSHDDLKSLSQSLQFSLTGLYLLYEYGKEMKTKVEIFNEMIATDDVMDQFLLETIRLAKKAFR